MKNSPNIARHLLAMTLALAGLLSWNVLLICSPSQAAARSQAASQVVANGKIAFTSDRDGNLEIYVMNPDGSNRVRITSNNVVDESPTWSPDGTKIAFVSQRQDGSFAIFIMNADGTGRTEVTALNSQQHGGEPSWSPDGGKIAFHDFSRNSDPDIFVVNIDGSGRQNLTFNHENYDTSPVWSPDGSKILFSRYDFYPLLGFSAAMLHTINADGTNLTPLQPYFSDGNSNEERADWSSATNKIVYRVDGWDAFAEHLYMANPDGTGRGFFYGCSLLDNPCRSQPQSATFSPDGTKIAFDVYDFYGGKTIKIYVKNVDGTGLTLLTDNGASPSWQPLLPPTDCPNPIDCNEFFVRQHYRDFLNREPDTDGLAFWTSEITSCGVDPRCIEVKRINDSSSFFLSIEFQETGYLVYRFYKTSYGDLPNGPVPVTLNEFLPDTRKLGQEVIVRQSGWEQKLEANKQAFAADFVQRSRFVAAYPTSMSAEQFVDALFANSGVTPSASDRSAALNEFTFAASTADVAARARALRRVAENSTLQQQELNRAFVLMQYFGYLRRNPNDPPEPGLNFDGYNFWLNKLNNFNGNFIVAEMVKAFLLSTEYRQRFGQP